MPKRQDISGYPQVRPGVRPVPQRVLLMVGLMVFGLLVMTAGVVGRLLT